MELSLTDRAVLITGAASGIGRACVEAFVREGARVGAVDRDDGALDAVWAGRVGSGGGVVTAAADVTDEEALADAVSRVADELGGIDAVVCCAGTSGPFGAPIESITADAFAQVFAVNVTGAFLTVKHALPRLRSGEHPAVVMMGSDSAFVAAEGMVPYNASKGALVQLTRALSTELAADGVRVNCVCPSIVDTSLSRGDLGVAEFASADYPVQTPDEVARHVLYLTSPASRPVNGTTLVSDFGYLARSSFPA